MSSNKINETENFKKSLTSAKHIHTILDEKKCNHKFQIEIKLHTIIYSLSYNSQNLILQWSIEIQADYCPYESIENKVCMSVSCTVDTVKKMKGHNF